MSRIYYVEPNDVSGKTNNGVPITPDYTDLCMSFNLVAEVTNRYDQLGDVNTEYIMTWSSRYDSNDPESYGSKVSFLQGANVKEYNYLTTYYSEIDYNKLVESNTVEGLGVTSCTITHDSWYLPQVTIEFTDVLGVSLFGREEAIHQKGGLSAENVFGVFFTQPYPKFRLQVKGFYGDAVTYQLMCSKFDAKFDSSRGYFIATVSFVGYNYSLLTDIPLNYLIASPYSKYQGRDYWDSHKGSPEWALSSGDAPPKLFDLLLEIRRAQLNISTDVNDYMTSDESSRVSEISNTISELDAIALDYDNVMNAIYNPNSTSSNVVPMFDDNNYKVVIQNTNDRGDVYNFIPKNQTDPPKVINLSKDFISAHNNYIDKIDAFNVKEKLFSENGHYIGQRPTKYLDKDNNDLTFGVLQEVKADKPYFNELVTQYKTKFTEFAKTNITSIKVYAITAGKTKQVIEAKKTELSNESNSLVQTGTDKINTEYQAMITVKPYVGDIIKIIFCHLETFIQMIYHCVDVIESSPANRSPEKLGVSSSQTTILTDSKANQSIVAPFPGVYSNTPREGTQSIVNTHTEAWLGDFSPDYEEIKLIVGLYEASEMLNDLSNALLEEKGPVALKGIGLLPSDLEIGNPFNYVAQELTKNVSSFAGHLGNRFAQLSVLNFRGEADKHINFFKLAGEADAINVVKSVGSKTLLKSQILDACTDGISTTITNIITCSADGDKHANQNKDGGKTYHDYERKKSSGRNPIFTLDGDKLTYTYLTHGDKKKSLCLLPIVSHKQVGDKAKFEENNVISVVTPDGETPFAIDDPFANTNKIREYVDYTSLTKFRNKYMVSLTTSDSDYSTSVEAFIGQVKSGEVAVDDIKLNVGLEEIVKRYCCHIEDISKFWTSKCVSPKVKDKTIGDMEHIYADYVGSNNVSISETDFRQFKVDDILGILDSGKSWNVGVKYGQTTAESTNSGNLSYKTCLYMRCNADLSVYNNGVIELHGDGNDQWYEIGKDNNAGHLFASPAYYSFNRPFNYDKIAIGELKLNKTNEKLLQEQHKNRRKAFLFVHTLEINPLVIGAKIKELYAGGPFAISLPLAYIWLVGGLLYRKRFNAYLRSSNLKDQSKESGRNIDTRDLLRSVSIGYPSEQYTMYVKLKNFGGSTDDESKYPLTLGLTNKLDANAITGKIYNVKVSDVFPIVDYDENLEWVFIEQFINFADNIYPRIASYLEFTINKNNSVFTDVEMLQLIKDIEGKGRQDYERTYSIGNYIMGRSTKNMEKTPSWHLKNGEDTFGRMMSKLSVKITPLNGKYSFIQCNEGRESINMLIDDDSPIQGFFSDLYNSVVILSSSANNNGAYNPEANVVNKSVYDAYIQSFEKKIKELCGVTDTPTSSDGGIDASINKDIARSLYANVKNIWDKWLNASIDRNSFNVDKFFTENFIFMDSFYKNIFKRFYLNYAKITKIYMDRRNQSSTLYSFLGDIASDHNMMFIAMADFNNIGHEDEVVAQQNLEKVFLPIPYNKMSNMTENNKFIFLYTHRPSSTPSNLDEDLLDNYNIWDYATHEITPLASKLFNTDTGDEGQMTRHGYDVPAFGVSFSRQNNHLFKNINLSMDNPVQTEQSMLVLNDIANLGASATNKVAFYGQDIYPIFSNYSYTCEVEMMGCAKIAPMMYFQLMNIPMWRGTYMIYNISHSISPGNFTTKFKGMKMSAKALPYNDNFVYTRSGANVMVGGGSLGSYGIDSSIGLSSTYPTINGDNLYDYFNDPKYRESSAKLAMDHAKADKKLQTLFNILFETMRKMNENKPKNERYGIVMASVVRDGNTNSQHYTGHAMDIQQAIYGNGYDQAPTTTVQGGDVQKTLYTVFDIVCTNYSSYIQQMILEYPDNSHLSSSNYNIHVLHIGVKETDKSPTQFYLSIGKKGSFELGLTWEQYKASVTPEHKYTIAKQYQALGNNFDKLKSRFVNLTRLNDSVTKEQFDEWIRDGLTSANIQASQLSCDATKGLKWNFGHPLYNMKYDLYSLLCEQISAPKRLAKNKVKKDRLPIVKEIIDRLHQEGMPSHVIEAVLAHVMKESEFNPKAKNPTSTATGLFQQTYSSGLFRKFGLKYCVLKGKTKEEIKADKIKLTEVLSGLPVADHIFIWLHQNTYNRAKDRKTKYYDALKSSENSIRALDIIEQLGFYLHTPEAHTDGHVLPSYKNALWYLYHYVPTLLKEVQGLTYTPSKSVLGVKSFSEYSALKGNEA